MNKLTTFVLCAVLALAVPAYSAPLDGDNNFAGGISFGKISGSSSSNISGNLSFSRYVDLMGPEWLPEFGLRQGGTYTFFEEQRDEWILDTEVFANVNWIQEPDSWVIPYVGVGFGGAYNDQTSTWTATPEAGVKFFVDDAGQTYIGTGFRYTFPFKDNDFGNGAMNAFMNVGYVWGGDRPTVATLQQELDATRPCCEKARNLEGKFNEGLRKQ